MADFTTWSALKTAILNDLSNGSALTKSYSIKGRARSFQDLDQVRKFLELCDMEIMAAEGDSGRQTLAQFERPGVGI